MTTTIRFYIKGEPTHKAKGPFWAKDFQRTIREKAPHAVVFDCGQFFVWRSDDGVEVTALISTTGGA